MQTFNAFAKASEVRGAIEVMLSFKVVAISLVGIYYWAVEVMATRWDVLLVWGLVVLV